jgi:mannuronan 5-epimerase
MRNLGENSWHFALHALVALVCAVVGSIAAARADGTAIQSKNYSYSDNALFVAPWGKDNWSGEKDFPFRTVGAAIAAVVNGGTVVLRAGTYRETLGGLSKRIVLQSYPGETVWIKGSVPATEWVAHGENWLTKNSFPIFCRSCVEPGNLRGDHLTAGYPEQLFLDGKSLEQVARLEDLGPGAFYADAESGTYVIRDNPTKADVEISVHNNAVTLWSGAEGSIVRGVGFAHYSPVAEPGHGAMVKVDAQDVVLENNTFLGSAVKAVSVFAKNVVVKENVFSSNGMMGLSAWNADKLAVSGNRFVRNNREHFAVTGSVSEAAGAKITFSQDVIIENNLFEGNYANGLWFDLGVKNAIISENRFKKNEGHGLFFEISSGAEISSNVLEDNAGSGIAISTSDQIEISGNVLANNAYALTLQLDQRPETAELLEANGGLFSIDFVDNLVTVPSNTKSTPIWGRDFSQTINADQMLRKVGDNEFKSEKGVLNDTIYTMWIDGSPVDLVTLDVVRRQ